ncbi:MAG: PAS domain S-box protein [Elusimicrobia bacterium]|nr:PAS domain S-box protein [Elusimicrobiota bacterium]
MKRRSGERSALKVSVYYIAAAMLFIVLGDYAMVKRYSIHPRMEAVATLKDVLFILSSAAAMYTILRRQFGQREEAIDTLRELNRAQRMSASCERAIIAARDRQELFEAIGRVAVEEGGYVMAFVGLAQDDPEKTVRVVAQSGDDPRYEGFAQTARIVWSDTARGRGPTGEAIRTGKSVIRRVDDPALAPWGDMIEKLGFGSLISLPLRARDRTVGAFTLYSARTDTFGAAETALLDKMAAAISYALDNLARAEKERAAFERLRNLSHAVENSPVSIVITDAAGTIEYVNRKFTEVSGFAAAEAVGKKPSMLKSGEMPKEEYAKMWRTISSGQVWHGEFHNRAKDGAMFWEWASISPVKDESGAITHYIAVKEDITAKRALEQQLRQAQKMETIGTLAGGIAHDFNNILTVIQGHCSLLEMAKLPNELDRESVTEIQSSVERAAALTRQLLAFGRRQPMHARRVDLNESAGKMTRMLRRLVPERIALECVLSDEPYFSRADPAMVDQIMMNLILNARDAIPAKGRILIETGAARDAAPPPHAVDRGRGWVFLRVSDDGAGIPQENLARVFEPFFTTKDASRGSGLGLSVVDGIVRQHKGWTTVGSEVGKGSTFTVYLPRDAQETAEGATPAAAPVPRGSETVLLAEDEAPLRRLCARTLSNLGYRVLEAGSGDAALEVWKGRDGKVPLLVTDMVMPGAVGGDELARRLRAQEPDLRVLYISGYHAPPEGGALNLEKGSAFLQKPFKPEELARQVRALLDGR